MAAKHKKSCGEDKNSGIKGGRGRCPALCLKENKKETKGAWSARPGLGETHGNL